MAAATSAVAGLVEALVSLRPLIDVLEGPFELAWPETFTSPADPTCLTAREILLHIARRLGIAATEARPSDGNSILHEIVARRLADASDAASLRSVRRETLPEIDANVDRIAAASFTRRCLQPPVRTGDGAWLRTYASGDSSGGDIVIVSACGMPAVLCQRWIAALARHRVVTWETRGLFDAVPAVEFDAIAHDVEAQARDLFAVMDAAAMRSAHVMGFCGGAVVAMAAAALNPARIDSLSLWHGDYEFGAGGQQTTHQANIRSLLRIAAASRSNAEMVRRVFCESARRRPNDSPNVARPELAHVLLYPFATAELLFRYARLNGAIMDRDVRALLPSIEQPALVITSGDDDTAHPAGSHQVAAGLAYARIHVMEHGNHISAFDAAPLAVTLVEGFIVKHDRVLLGGRGVS